uniref:Uncharacterized protein n=1 Tax=Glossina austeni TaxID=7395 RepID=A0A1A9UCT8_GLOAU
MDSVVNSMQPKRSTTLAAEKKSEGIAPILIKQLLKSAEGNFPIFGMTFSMITAHYWLEEGDTLKAPDVMLNKYATVYGSVRSQGGQKTVILLWSIVLALHLR